MRLRRGLLRERSLFKARCEKGGICYNCQRMKKVGNVEFGSPIAPLSDVRGGSWSINNIASRASIVANVHRAMSVRGGHSSKGTCAEVITMHKFIQQYVQQRKSDRIVKNVAKNFAQL